MNAFLASTRALVAASLGLMAWGLSHADTAPKLNPQTAGADVAPAASAQAGVAVKDVSKALGDKKKKGAASVKGEDHQYPAVTPRPPQPPRLPGDPLKPVGNKAVSP
jgi:hypothetical protein